MSGGGRGNLRSQFAILKRRSRSISESSVLLANGEFSEIPYEIHLIFFKSFSTALNSRSPVTNSAFLILAKAAAKQSA